MKTICRCYLILFAVVIAQHSLAAQKLQKSATPIEVVATPATAVLNSAVQISGTSAVDGKRMDVKIVITPPAAKSSPPAQPALLTAHADAKGNFTARFKATSAAGNYLVRATSPDGKGNATTQFTVVGASSGVSSNLDQAVVAANDLVSASGEAEAAAEELISRQPKSPPQEEVLAKLSQLKGRLSQAQQQTAQIKPGWAKIQSSLDKYPQALPVFQPLLSDLNDWQTRAKNEADKIRKQLQHSASKGVTCDQIDAAVQMLNWVSYGLDFTDELFVKLRTVAEDKAVPDKVFALLPPSARNENVKFLFAESMKAADAVWRGPAAWFSTAASFAVDIAAFAKQRQFDRYCEKFQGPISATLHADFYENMRHYWSYDMDLDGRLVLRFARAKSAGDAIHVSGEYEGHATRFTLWDDFIALYPKMASDVLYHSDRPPAAPGSSKLEEWAGRVPGTVFSGPTSFSIPVEGDFVKDKITVNLGNADHDIDVKGKVIYIFVAPGVFIPDTITAEAPYQTAQWIISRSIGMKPEFTVTVDTKNQISIIQRDFNRDVKAPDGSYKLQFKANVKACNPQCP
jgi:hypothetical protein